MIISLLHVLKTFFGAASMLTDCFWAIQRRLGWSVETFPPTLKSSDHLLIIIHSTISLLPAQNKKQISVHNFSFFQPEPQKWTNCFAPSPTYNCTYNILTSSGKHPWVFFATITRHYPGVFQRVCVPDVLCSSQRREFSVLGGLRFSFTAPPDEAEGAASGEGAGHRQFVTTNRRAPVWLHTGYVWPRLSLYFEQMTGWN